MNTIGANLAPMGKGIIGTKLTPMGETPIPTDFGGIGELICAQREHIGVGDPCHNSGRQGRTPFFVCSLYAKRGRHHAAKAISETI